MSYDMDPNVLIYVLNDFKVTCSKILQFFFIIAIL